VGAALSADVDAPTEPDHFSAFKHNRQSGSRIRTSPSIKKLNDIGVLLSVSSICVTALLT
jgi:hypothetical protein